MSQDTLLIQVLKAVLGADLAIQLGLVAAVVIFIPIGLYVAFRVKRRWAYEEKRGALEAEQDHAGVKGVEKAVSPALVVCVASFEVPATANGCEKSLSFVELFDGRFIKSADSWDRDIWPRLRSFFADLRQLSRPLRLRLDAHSTIAFACGALVDVKSGIALEVEQKGERGIEVWTPTTSRELRTLPGLLSSPESLGNDGPDIAVALSITRSVTADVRTYVTNYQPMVGSIVAIMPEGGPGQGRVIDGDHAACLADAVAAEINDMRGGMGAKGRIHLFASAPNSLMVALGRRSLSFGALQLYEFDFQRAKTSTYMPSLELGGSAARESEQTEPSLVTSP
ncbi:MAG: SAVED domain-containing protein [Candidatus Zixiibacteriota bacterium]